jgi:hypothetical protein
MTWIESQQPDFTKRAEPISARDVTFLIIAVTSRHQDPPFLIRKHPAKPFSKSHMYTDESEPCIWT